MTTRQTLRVPRRGFTLVELITVMGILAILVTFVVGAAQGLKDSIANKATRATLVVLDAALRKYYDDWGKYPWREDTPDGVMGKVDPNELFFKTADIANPDYNESLLFAALNMRRRTGPYLPGGSGQTIDRRILVAGATLTYQLYADGWGRPITYQPPKTGTFIPLLTSKGKNEFDAADDITNQ